MHDAPEESACYNRIIKLPLLCESNLMKFIARYKVVVRECAKSAKDVQCTVRFIHDLRRNVSSDESSFPRESHTEYNEFL